MSSKLTYNNKKNLSGSKIRFLRKSHGYSQEELCARLQLIGFDCERGVIKRIENGTRFVSDIELKLFANFFNVTLDYLISD